MSHPKPFRPLLAATLTDPDKVRFPAMVSPKIDGIRCIILDGNPVTRTLKPIPNKFIRSQLSGFDFLDGELTVGDPQSPRTWNDSSSAIMSHDGEPNFTFHVFDYVNQFDRFEDRYEKARREVELLHRPFVRLLEHYHVYNFDEIGRFEQRFVRQGYEGLMIRSAGGFYKYGRSTENEGTLLKMKRWDDNEATIVGFEERQHHIGEAKINALGLTERDHRKENFTGTGDLGALNVQMVNGVGKKVEFAIGSGFDAGQRVALWGLRDQILDKPVRFKHLGWTPEGKPRCPIYLGLRHADDMGEPAHG